VPLVEQAEERRTRREPSGLESLGVRSNGKYARAASIRIQTEPFQVIPK